MLSTPIMVNLITEFRPDLYWRLLCGINPPGYGPQIPGRQLGARQRHGARRRVGATRQTVRLAGCCGTAGGRGDGRVACRWREIMVARGSGRALLRGFVKFAGLTLIFVVPYFTLSP